MSKSRRRQMRWMGWDRWIEYGVESRKNKSRRAEEQKWLLAGDRSRNESKGGGGEGGLGRQVEDRIVVLGE